MAAESGDPFSAVFMTGSGSTIFCAGSDQPPEFLMTDSAYADTFVLRTVRPSRLITRVGDDGRLQLAVSEADRKLMGSCL